MTRGRLIALEGGEASGKSTQAAALAESVGALLTREPGGTALGKRLRALLLDPGAPPVGARAEALLMLADRAQHAAEVLEPALAAGRWVVTDRYVASTLSYQGLGRGLAMEELEQMSAWASCGLRADLNVLLEVSAAEVTRRLAGRPGTDRMEGEAGGFHERVAAGYRMLAEADPGSWAVVDGAGSVEEVAARVRRAVEAHLGAGSWTAGRG